MGKEVIPEPMLERVAQRFKLLSEPIRLQIINQLMVEGEMSVMKLVDAIGQKQANVSKHLNLLAREGLLARRKDGLQVFYRIEDPSLHGLCMLVCGRIREEAVENLKGIEASAPAEK